MLCIKDIIMCMVYSCFSDTTWHTYSTLFIINRNVPHICNRCKNTLHTQPQSILYCIVLYCIVSYSTVLYHIILYSIALYCIVLYCVVLHCIALYCIVLYCVVLYCFELYGILCSHSARACVSICVFARVSSH